MIALIDQRLCFDRSRCVDTNSLGSFVAERFLYAAMTRHVRQMVEIDVGSCAVD